MKDMKARSVVKAISWRFIASVTTMTLIYLATGRFDIAAGVGAIEVVLKIAFYYLHERAWDNISYGRMGNGQA